MMPQPRAPRRPALRPTPCQPPLCRAYGAHKLSLEAALAVSSCPQVACGTQVHNVFVYILLSAVNTPCDFATFLRCFYHGGFCIAEA